MQFNMILNIPSSTGRHACNINGPLNVSTIDEPDDSSQQRAAIFFGYVITHWKKSVK